MEQITIEKNVPLPAKRLTGLSAVVAGLVVGDSFVIDKLRRPTVYIAAARAGVKVTIRTEGDSLRVWRVA